MSILCISMPIVIVEPYLHGLELWRPLCTTRLASMHKLQAVETLCAETGCQVVHLSGGWSMKERLLKSFSS